MGKARSLALSLVFCAAVVLCLLPMGARALYVGVEGGPGVLAQPVNGKVKLSLGGKLWGSIALDGSVSFLPVSGVTLSKGQSSQRLANFPVFLGLETRFFFSRTQLYSAKNDGYAGLGADFHVDSNPNSLIPGVKLTLGYTRRIVRAFYWELSTEYYVYGVLQSELFFLTGFKYSF